MWSPTEIGTSSWGIEIRGLRDSRTNGNEATQTCPCGFHGDRLRDCVCTAEQVSRYRTKVSGPLLDRIDLFVEAARPRQILIPGKGQPGESSSAVRKRVAAAHRIQIEHQGVANA